MLLNWLMKRVRNTSDDNTVMTMLRVNLRISIKVVDTPIEIVTALYSESRSNQERSRTLLARAIKMKDVQMSRNPQTVVRPCEYL